MTNEDIFWYFIAERHAIYLRRKAGLPKPWTDDPILRDYKFTNPFRQNDRGTVWLTNFLEPHLKCQTCGGSGQVPYEEEYMGTVTRKYEACPGCPDTLAAIAFNICWFRMFNWTGTGEALGWRTDWDEKEIIDILSRRLANKEQVFTGAHIVYSRPGFPKIDAIVGVCSELFHMCYAGGALVTCAREERSLEAVFKGLIQADCVGGFMAYEMVTDMRHTPLLNDAHDIMTWANMGPGAQRGLRRLGYPATNQKQGNTSMQQLLDNWREKLGPKIPAPYTLADYPLLEMRDIEHSLCETDKYLRTKNGEGFPRGKFPGRA